MENLIRIVHKITNYVPWQSKGLTEEEFRVLDQAKGIELAKIAYENRLNFNRFLKNADKMIDKYNEQLLQIQIKEVRALKRTLQSNVAFIKNKVEPAVNTDRNVPEIPEENVIMPVNEIEPQIEQVEQQMNAIHCESDAAQIVPEVRTFQSMLTDLDDASKSVPVHRDIVRPTNGVTFDENRPIPNVSNNPEVMIDDMPVLNDDELAQMGVFTLAHSKRTSRVVQDIQKSVSNLAIPEIQVHLPKDLTTENIPPPIENIDSLQIDQHINRVQEMDQGIQSLAINEPDQIQQQSVAAVEVPSINILRRSSSTNVRDSMAERWEDFRLAINAADVMLGKAKRRVKRPQRAQKKQQTQQVEDENELNLFKLRKDVPYKNKRRNRPRPVKHFKQHNIIPNIFDDVDTYLQNDLPFEEEQIFEEIEVLPQHQTKNRVSGFNEFNMELDQPGTSKHRVMTSTPMNLASKKRLNVSPPEQSQTSKRMRTLESIGDIQDPVINQPENIAAIPECPELLTSESGLVIPNLPASIREPSILPTIIEDPFEQPLERQVDPSIEIPQRPKEQEILPIIEHDPPMQQSADNQELSRDQSLPQPRRLTRLAVLENLHITADSIDYDRLRRNSQLRKTPLDDRLQIAPDEIFQNAVENISDREAGKSQRAAEIHIARTQIREVDVPLEIPQPQMHELVVPQSTETFVDLPKVMMNGEYHYELKSNDGNRIIYVNESRLKCIQLYMKIRIIMKSVKGTASPWKMTIKEVFGHLKGLNEPKFVTYQRLKYMAQQKLFIAECSEDGRDLLGIEIPIDTFGDANDKENNP